MSANDYAECTKPLFLVLKFRDRESEEFAAIAFSAKVTLTSAIRVEQPLNIVGDSDRLYRLVSNLIINAIQYTPQFGKVTVVLERGENCAVIQVQDTGIGIPYQELTRIFDRFYRVNSDRSRKTGGSGLGLAIAKAIIKSHQGSSCCSTKRAFHRSS